MNDENGQYTLHHVKFIKILEHELLEGDMSCCELSVECVEIVVVL